MSMFNAHLVLLTSDRDCDGVSFGAQRVTVPQHRVCELLRDTDALMAHLRASDQMSYGLDGTYDVMTAATFHTTFPLNAWASAYFAEVGYTSAHISPSWESWVYDDTIGIPALDSRYED